MVTIEDSEDTWRSAAESDGGGVSGWARVRQAYGPGPAVGPRVRARTVSFEEAKSIKEEDVRMESDAAYDAAFLKATSAFMGTLLQAKSARKLVDPVNYKEREGDEEVAAANREVGRWRLALGLMGVVDVVLLLTLLLGLFSGRLDKFWDKHVHHYDVNTSDADVALLVLCRGVLNAAVAFYIKREAWLLGKGAFPFSVSVAALNAATFVAMIVKSTLLQWRDDANTTVSAAALTVFLLTGLMEAPVVYQFIRAVRKKQALAAAAAAAPAAGSSTRLGGRLAPIPSEANEEAPHRGNEEPPSLKDAHGETVYTSVDIERGELSLGRASEAPDAGADGGKKAKGPKKPKAPRGLSMKQIMLVLQPYFWPSKQSRDWFQNRVRCVACWLLIAASKITTIVSPLFLQKAINYLGGKGEGAAGAAGDANLGKAAMNAVLFCALALLGVIFQETQTLLYLNVRKVACSEISQATFKHIMALSMKWQLNAKVGKTIRAIDRGMDSVNTIVTYLFLTLLPALGEAAAVIIIFVAYYGQWDSSVLLLVGLTLFGYVTIRITNRRRYYRHLSNQMDSKIHERAADSIIMFESVKAFTNEPFECYKYKTGVWEYQKLDAETDASLSYLTMAQGFILLTFQMGILLLTVRRVVDGEISVGGFVAINKWVDNAFAPLKVLSSVYNSVSKAMVDMENLNALLAEVPDIVDPPGTPAFAFDREATRIKKNSGPVLPPPTPQARDETKENLEAEDDGVAGLGNSIEVKFDDITFHYHGQNPERGLKNVTFTIKRGTTTAVVGHTGSGKSTLARLLFRFYDPLGGAVRFNGEDIKKYKQRSIRKVIGVVPQDTCLFNDTMLNNIRYGRLDATFEEIEAAVEAAQLTPFIEALSDGYDTMVGERGLKLSGGEKQRVAIARCILKNPPIVLLDEATSALDTKTEKEITDALNRLGKNRTMFVVAHRLSTVKSADQIIVMDKGCIAEMGTHDELLALKGQYRRMWDLQVNKDEQ